MTNKIMRHTNALSTMTGIKNTKIANNKANELG